MTSTDVISDDLPAPVIVRKIGRVPAFTLTEAARFLGGDMPSQRNRLHGLATRNLIHPRLSGMDKPKYKLGLDELAVATMLLAVNDLGVCDMQVSSMASVACYAWDRNHNPRPHHLAHCPSPIVAALLGTYQGDPWTFMLCTYRNDQTNARHVGAVLFQSDMPPDLGRGLPEAFLPRATLLVEVAPLLMPLTRAFAPARGN